MKNDSLYFLAAAGLCAAMLLTPARTQAARNRNLNINFQGSAEHCSDLKATSRDGEVAQANETFTLTKAEAPVLEVNGVDRGIFNIRGWDRAEYSVETCKLAVAETRAAAEQAVRGISVSRSAGHFSASGPSGSDTDWQVYFIVHAPKEANLDLETRNGPISIKGVTGTLKVRSTNGPVSLHDSSGTLEVHTNNGPISFANGGGEVHLVAQNGPISLDLAGDIWNGSKLDAHTVNGPVSVSMPATFHSGVRVETSGHAPVSCSIDPCRGAWTDTSSNQHVMQFNGSQDTVRVSTSNGPVSVHAPKKDRNII
jgi:hypothetical protein